MKRITISLTAELEKGLNTYLAQQDTAPSMTSLMQAALSDYLYNAELSKRGYQAAKNPFNPKAYPEKDNQGEADVSLNHDIYIGKP